MCTWCSEMEDVSDKNLYTFTISSRSAWQEEPGRGGRSGRRLRKNGELGSFIGRISRLIRAEDAHRRIAGTDVCASDGSQMYSHTLSTFLHPLKLRNLDGYLVRYGVGRQSWDTKRSYIEASANGSVYLALRNTCIFREKGNIENISQLFAVWKWLI